MGKLFDKTFWKFIIVGVINTLVGTSVMFLMYMYYILDIGFLLLQIML